MLRDFPIFSPTCIFSLLTFFISELLLLWTAFSSLHIVGNLASKLPSINKYIMKFSKLFPPSLYEILIFRSLSAARLLLVLLLARVLFDHSQTYHTHNHFPQIETHTHTNHPEITHITYTHITYTPITQIIHRPITHTYKSLTYITHT